MYLSGKNLKLGCYANYDDAVAARKQAELLHADEIAYNKTLINKHKLKYFTPKEKKAAQNIASLAYRRRNPVATLFRGARNMAKHRNLEFTLQLSDMTTPSVCAYCGCDLSLCNTGRPKGNSASIDRIDSTKGYTPDNWQWLCFDCNRCKSNFRDPKRFLHIYNGMMRNMLSDHS